MEQKVSYVRQGSAKNNKTTATATNALKTVNMRHSYLISCIIIIDVVIIIASIWVAIEAIQAMRRAWAEPPEDPDADEQLVATRENV